MGEVWADWETSQGKKPAFMWLSEVRLWIRGAHLEGPLVGPAPVLSAQAEGVGLRGRRRRRVLELPGRRNRHHISHHIDVFSATTQHMRAHVLFS